MSWGTDLWDQYDVISGHTQKGIDFCERYTHFIKERCAIESEYATKLKKLVRNYQPKKKGEEDNQFSWSRGFVDMMKEVHDIASQHELISENLTSNVIKECQNLIIELKQERKKSLQEGAKTQQQLNKVLENLEKSKRFYEKNYREAERAQDNFRKADADINLSRAEVEKHKAIAQIKLQQSDESKNEYAATLQDTNRHQHSYYTSLMPGVFQQLQDLDEKRIAQIQNFIKESASVERGVIPIINTCIEGMENAANSVNPVEDSRLVIDRFKTGFEYPGDIAFEDLSSPTSSAGSGSDTSLNTPKNNSMNRTVSGTVSGKNKKRTGLFGIFSSSKPGGKTEDHREDYSNLAPNQQKKQLLKKLEKIKQDIAKETAERDGMMKMRGVYENNSSLGDPASLDKKLDENGQKLDELNQELQKYDNYLATADGRSTPNMGRKRSSVAIENITHSVTDLSVTDGGSNIPTSNSSHQINITSPDGNTSGNTYQDQESFDEDGAEFDGILGTARAKFPFEATVEGSVSMTQDEELYIVDRDHNDGWTRVRKLTGEEGFVPTTYAHCHFYGEQCVDCGENVPSL